MPNKAQSASNAASDKDWTVSDRVAGAAGEAKQKVSEFGRTAAKKVDESRSGAATGLEEAATLLDEKAESLPGGEKVTSLAHATADKLTSTANYVREHDVNQMMADVESVVKNNPGASLLTAAVFGFLLGRAFTSRD